MYYCYYVLNIYAFSWWSKHIFVLIVSFENPGVYSFLYTSFSDYHPIILLVFLRAPTNDDKRKSFVRTYYHCVVRIYTRPNV